MNILRFQEDEKYPFLQKLGFAINYYNFFIHNVGRLEDCELETPIAIVERVIHQIENNKPRPKKQDNRPQYIDRHLTKLQGFIPVLGEKMASHLSTFFESEYFNSSNKSKPLKHKEDALLSALQILANQLRDGALKEIIGILKSYVFCTHSLEDHKDSIIEVVRLFASEVIFYTKSVNKALSFMKSVFSNDIHEFPFSNEFKDNLSDKSEKEREQAQKDFIENLSWEDRFETLFRFLEFAPKEQLYIFRLLNVDFGTPNFEVDYGVAKFYSRGCAKMQSIIDQLDKERLDKFFSDECKAYLLLSAKGCDGPSGLARAKIDAAIWVESLNRKIRGNAFFDRRDYVYTSNSTTYGGSISLVNLNRPLSSIDAQKLKDDSAFEVLKNPTSKSAVQFLQFETAYTKAHNTRSLSDYWQYLENLFEGELVTRFVKYTSKLILGDQQYYVKQTIYDSFSLLSNSAESLGLESWEAQRDIQKEMKSEKFDYQALSTRQKDLFVNFLIGCLQKLSLERIESQVERILHELREARNFIEHSGAHSVHAELLAKLDLIIPDLIYQFRRKLVADINKNPDLNINEILSV